MATKEMSYDARCAPADCWWVEPCPVPTGYPKFAAHAAMIVKAVNTCVQTAGTSADHHYFYKVSGTTTSTTTLHSVASAATGAAQTLTSNTLALGDLFYVAKGTDATLVEGCGIELQLIPARPSPLDCSTTGAPAPV